MKIPTTYLFLLISSIALFSFSQIDNLEDEFIVKEYNLKIDKTPTDVIFYNNHYYCMFYDKEMLCLNSEFNIDKEITSLINKYKFSSIYQSGDKIVGCVFDKKPEKNKYYFLDKDYNWVLLTEGLKENPFYEDEDFLISECCDGEWGGTLFFKDKKTNNIYGCPSSCAINVNKFKGNYYVTNTMIHMGSSSQIFKIKNPKKLFNLTKNTFKIRCGWENFRSPDKEYLRKMDEMKKAIDKTSKMFNKAILISFLKDNQIYHITTDNNKTYLSKSDGDSLKYVKTISKNRLIAYNPNNIKC